MRQPVVLCSSFLVSLAFAASASAGTLYVSPDGTATSGCTADLPCDLTSAATVAVPGDTVILKGGVYKTALTVPEKTGSSATAWLTFKAADCELPIIEGPGVGPLDTNQDSGVFSSKATYLRFDGIVSRGWSTGFGNGWTGTDTTNSNGHFEFKNCIADSNGRTGFTFFSAEGIHAQNNISAHNGSSIKESWSSGFTLYEAQGGAGSNVIEGNVSFENMDNHDETQAPDSPGRHSDGNGFIIDEYSNGATFINNIAFRNAGSCLRLTKSSNAKFINNTCYHNAQDTRDEGPTNPGEIYFTDSSTKMGVTIMNNVFIATGTGPGKDAVFGQPTSGWSNNVVGTGAAAYFTAAEGMNPDFSLTSAATDLIGKGGAGDGVPGSDIGFDPKCIVKKTPVPIGMMDKGSWWQYSIDYDYIKMIGGVARCFTPATRTGTPDIGSYKAGAITKAAACVASTGGSSSGGASAGGSGGGSAGASVGGASGVAGGGTTGVGGAGGGTSGATSVGGAAGGASGAAGGASTAGSGTVAGGNTGSAGQPSGTAGTVSGSGGSSSTAGTSSAAGSVARGGNAAAGTGGSTPPSESSGCGCRTSPQPDTSQSLAGLGLLGLGLIGIRRRRQSR
jgi:MYXO-CTERM domain-containing protein